MSNPYQMAQADIDHLWDAVNWLSAQRCGGVAVRVWAALWSEADLSMDCRVKANRQWIAEKARTTPAQVSRVLTLLVGVGAIRRDYERRACVPQVKIWMKPGFRFP